MNRRGGPPAAPSGFFSPLSEIPATVEAWKDSLPAYSDLCAAADGAACTPPLPPNFFAMRCSLGLPDARYTLQSSPSLVP